MGCTSHAPLPATPSKILDIGCGTGVVTSYFGHTNPSASVYGIDLSAVPDIHRTPPNVQYVKGDIHNLATEQAGGLPPGTADLVFARLLVCGITDWPACIARMRDLAKPGGWIELQDLNNQLFNHMGRRVDENFEWMRVLRSALTARGLDPDAGYHARGHMERAGLVDVQSLEYKFTIGTWLAEREPATRRMGDFKGKGDHFVLATLLDEALDKSQYGQERQASLKEEMRRDMQYRLVGEEGIYYTFTVTYGRRPLKGEEL
jgi:SAM-dependent methyltransferase